MNLESDSRLVLTLDAGGTNFVFSAIRGGREVVEPLSVPSSGDDLPRCLETILSGFRRVASALPDRPAAISFAFPGPADYPLGIIGDLQNLPGFRGGVALGPMLEEAFEIPVYINNDGDLFAYGEAIAGLLPEVNRQLERAGSPRRFRNLVGVTIGTGFGAGIVGDGRLFSGDNSVAGEIWLLRNRLEPERNAEEGASIRAVQRVYAELAGAGAGNEPLSPRDIYEIACGRAPGHVAAAREAYRSLARVAGDALANALTLVDGLAVVGGGIAGAAPLFLPMLIEEMRGSFRSHSGAVYPRLVQSVYNLDDETERGRFLSGGQREIAVPGSGRRLEYDPEKRIGIGTSRLGTSRAVAVGAYAFALDRLGNPG